MISVAGTFRECRDALKRREVPCPDCGEPMRPRGYLGPLKKLRGSGEDDGAWPGRPRGECDRCRRSHVLQPAGIVAHRSDVLSVLAGALLAFAAGARPAQVAQAAGVPARTARGWREQAGAFARRHLPAFTAILAGLGGQDLLPGIGGNSPVPALAAILPALAEAAAGKYGGAGIPEWERVNLICRGRFLSPSLDPSYYRELAYPVTA